LPRLPDDSRTPGVISSPTSASHKKEGVMIYGNRDVGINYIRTRNNHTCYGMGIGIMVLVRNFP